MNPSDAASRARAFSADRDDEERQTLLCCSYVFSLQAPTVLLNVLYWYCTVRLAVQEGGGA